MERDNRRIRQKTIRLNRYLAQCGVTSRRKADDLIKGGEVELNGKVVTELGTQIDPEQDRITVNGRPVSAAQKLLYIVFNKPKNCITTMSDEKGRETVMKYVQLRDRVFPVGRLDRNTTGVLFLTNDGDFANGLMHPSHEIERIYRVTLDRPFSDIDMNILRRGVKLDDGTARAKEASIIEGSKRKKVLLSLREGKNREVRRIFEALDYDVRQLDRIAYAGIVPYGISRGEWRFLTRDEVAGINRLIKKKEPGSAPRNRY
jgi:pseudouridine synthase